jgi:hypothetical protein
MKKRKRKKQINWQKKYKQNWQQLDEKIKQRVRNHIFSAKKEIAIMYPPSSR